MGVLKVWDGTAWQNISASGDGTVAYVGPEAPPGTPDAGDMWWDTDETAPSVTVPLGVVNGGTGATSPATARTSLAVPSIGSSILTAGAPTTGTWARGDQYLDSNNVVWTCVTAGTPGTWTAPPGTELTYGEITSTVSITATTEAASDTIITAPATVFDGVARVNIEFGVGTYAPPATAGAACRIILFQDGVAIGWIASVNGAASALGLTIYAKRRMTPTVGSHIYSVRGFVSSGTGTVYVGPGGSNNNMPGYIRITRA